MDLVTSQFARWWPLLGFIVFWIAWTSYYRRKDNRAYEQRQHRFEARREADAKLTAENTDAVRHLTARLDDLVRRLDAK